MKKMKKSYSSYDGMRRANPPHAPFGLVNPPPHLRLALEPSIKGISSLLHGASKLICNAALALSVNDREIDNLGKASFTPITFYKTK